MIQRKIAKDLQTAREFGQSERAKILAIVEGEMSDLARRRGEKSSMLNDDDANEILRRHMRHAGISLQMNPSDPTAELVIELVGEYLVSDVMSDSEMRERILASGLSNSRDILKYLSTYGDAVDMARARSMVQTVFGS